MDKSLIDRLLRLDTPCISDVRDDLRIMDRSIQTVNPELKVAGRAFTVYSEGDIIPVLMGILQAEAGDVLVIESCGCKEALFGELISLDARRKGLKGIVTDGICRDVEGIKRADFPVFAKGASPRVAGKSKTGELQTAIVLGGVTIRPGDIIFGDQDGVVVLDPGEAAEVIAAAEKVQEMEAQVMKRILDGMPFDDMLNTREHYDNLKAGRPSEFRFKP